MESTQQDYQKRYDKAVSAICTITGILEARVEFAIEGKQHHLALTMLADLMRLHEERPVHLSKQWMEKYEEQREEVWKLLASK